MVTQTQEKILAYLLGHMEEKITIRGIAKRLGKSYTLVYNNIADLEQKGMIEKENVPPGQIISINKFSPTHMFIDIELNRMKDFLQKFPWLQLMLEDFLASSKTPFFILLVFGSYAKGKQTGKSDLDVLIIMQNKKDIKDIENSLKKIYTKVKKSLTVVDIDDFKDMVSNPNSFNVGNEARKCHILLYGVEGYYQLLRRVHKE